MLSHFVYYFKSYRADGLGLIDSFQLALELSKQMEV